MCHNNFKIKMFKALPFVLKFSNIISCSFKINAKENIYFLQKKKNQT